MDFLNIPRGYIRSKNKIFKCNESVKESVKESEI